MGSHTFVTLLLVTISIVEVTCHLTPRGYISFPTQLPIRRDARRNGAVHIYHPPHGWGWRQQRRRTTTTPSPLAKLPEFIHGNTKLLAQVINWGSLMGSAVFQKIGYYKKELEDPFKVVRNMQWSLNTAYHPVPTIASGVKVIPKLSPSGGGGGGKSGWSGWSGQSSNIYKRTCKNGSVFCSIAQNLGEMSQVATDFGKVGSLGNPHWYEYGIGQINVNDVYKGHVGDKGQNQGFEPILTQPGVEQEGWGQFVSS